MVSATVATASPTASAPYDDMTMLEWLRGGRRTGRNVRVRSPAPSSLSSKMTALTIGRGSCSSSAACTRPLQVGPAVVPSRRPRPPDRGPHDDADDRLDDDKRQQEPSRDGQPRDSRDERGEESPDRYAAEDSLRIDEATEIAVFSVKVVEHGPGEESDVEHHRRPEHRELRDRARRREDEKLHCDGREDREDEIALTRRKCLFHRVLTDR